MGILSKFSKKTTTKRNSLDRKRGKRRGSLTDSAKLACRGTSVVREDDNKCGKQTQTNTKKKTSDPIRDSVMLAYLAGDVPDFDKKKGKKRTHKKRGKPESDPIRESVMLAYLG
mmetsp:Transcript_21976/g.54389  ORF Transcript_21976/g.54389 Transcript_21976/m.54389 type:complete len:114 (+) Transcript_21976:85-426(+)